MIVIRPFINKYHNRLNCAVRNISISSQRFKTIYALSSGSLPSAIAVIRISGSESESVLKILTRRKEFESMRLFYGKIYDRSGNVLDRAMSCFMKGPKTFTGDDSAELYLHGSRAVVNAVFSTLASIPGLESAKAGEFTKRAFLNGKMNVLEVEALCGLICAETENQRIIALRHIQNGNYLRPIRNELIDLAARLEAHIDFGEELAADATIQESELLQKAQEIQQKLRALQRSAQRGALIRTGINVALVGRTNVGKSSLMNRLAEKEVSIVSNVPGTTRDSLQLRLQFNSTFLNFVDTAGIRETDDILECEGIRRSVKRAEEANIIVLVIDKHDLEIAINEIKFLLEKINFNPALQRLVVCLNKSDLSETTNMPNLTKLLSDYIKQEYKKASLYTAVTAVWTSCLTEDGPQRLINEFERLITEEFSMNSLLSDDAADGNHMLLSSNRHLELLERATNEIHNFEEAFYELSDLGIAAHHLRGCASAVGEISGDVVNQEIMDRLFSTMCIGK